MVFIRILEHHKRIVQELFAIRCFNPDWNYLYTSVRRKKITSLLGLAGMPSFLRLPLSFLFYKVMKRIKNNCHGCDFALSSSFFLTPVWEEEEETLFPPHPLQEMHHCTCTGMKLSKTYSSNYPGQDPKMLPASFCTTIH